MVVTEGSPAREPNSPSSGVNLASMRNATKCSVAATIAAVVSSSYTTTTTNASSDRRQVRPSLQSNNNKSLSKSSSMMLTSSTLNKATIFSVKKSIANNDSTIEDTASCRVPPSNTTTTTASTILGVVASLVESCRSGVPLEGAQMDAFLAATGRLHTLMLGPDLNVNSCILSSLLGMDTEVWACGEDPTTPPDRCVPGVPAHCTTPGPSSGRERPLDFLLRVLEGCSNCLPAAAVCALLHQLLAPDNREELRRFVLSSLVAGHAMESILRCLFRVQEKEGQTGLDAVTLPAYQVMAKLAVKDPRCLVRFRLLGGVLLSHRLLLARMQPHPDAQTLPLLMVLRAISKNGSNQQLLGRDGCVLTLTKMLALTPKSHATKIKYILDILALLTNSKSNVAKCIRDGALADVVQVLEHWQQYDIKVLPKIIRPVVALLGHVAETKKGRQVLDEAGAVALLEQFVLNCPDQKHLDLAVGFASTLYLRCRGGSSGSLPGVTAFPAITFTLPDEVEETNSVQNELIMESSTQQQFNSNALAKNTIQTPSAYMSDDDDDDNDDEDDDELDENNDTSTPALPGVGEPCSFFSPIEDASNAEGEASGFPSLQMPMGELLKYSTFFPELQPCARDQEEFDYWKNISDPGKDPSSLSSPDCYQRLSSLTRSLVPFVKLAYPDLFGASSPRYLEPLYDKQPRMARTVALQRVQRAMRGEALHRVVFDLDSLLQAQRAQQRIAPLANTQRPLSNWDEKRVGRRDVSTPYLNFESRFESGNLRRAVQVEEREYELVLNCDVSSRQHHQWFYFEVSNMEAGVPYVFSIINNEKPGSEFNAGMKPLLYSVKEAMQGRNYWVRTGTNIFYHRNHYTKAHPPRNPNNRYSTTSTNGGVIISTTPANDRIDEVIRNDDGCLPHQDEKNGLSPASPFGTAPDSRIEYITMNSHNSMSNTTCFSEQAPPNLSKNSNNASEDNCKPKRVSVIGAGRGSVGMTNYYTASFTIIFPHSYDVCYLAYHYPYNYTNLQRFLSDLRQQSLPRDTFFSCQTLCRSLNGNPVPVITITSKQSVPTPKFCSSAAEQSASEPTDSLKRSHCSVPSCTGSVRRPSTSSSSERSSLKFGVPAKGELREQQNTLDSLDCDSLSNEAKKSTHRDDIDAVSDCCDSTCVDSLPAVTSDKHSVVVDHDDSQVNIIVCDNVDVFKNSSVVAIAKSKPNDEGCIVDQDCKYAEVFNKTHSESVVVDDNSSIVIIDSDKTVLQNNDDAKVESDEKSVAAVSLSSNVKSIAIKYSDLFADDGSSKVKVAAKTGTGIGSVNRNCDNIKRNFVKFNEMSNKTETSSCVSRRRKTNSCDNDDAGAREEKAFHYTNKSVSGSCSNKYSDKILPSEQLSPSTESCSSKIKNAAVSTKASEYPQTPVNEDTPDFSTAVAVEDMWSKLTSSAPPLVKATATEGGDAATEVGGSTVKERREEALKSSEADQSSYNRVKPVVFLSSRVHPGETNASWIMQGSLTFLLSDTAPARALRERYVFKVVPMLNPEGVIHGNTRCGLTAEDLNRRWKAPSPRIHPTIYNTKALLEYLTRIVSKRDVSHDSQPSGANTCVPIQGDADGKDDLLASRCTSDDADPATTANATATSAVDTATSTVVNATCAGDTALNISIVSPAQDPSNDGAAEERVPTAAPSINGAVIQASNVSAGGASSGAAPASNVVRVFCDYHGHSRQKNLFLYGCSRQLSWRIEDNELPDNQDLMELPQLCQRSVPAFSGRNCCYTVESHREATARVSVWRQCAIPCSYTLEASACGCDQGLYQGYHLGTHQLLESGARFCQSLLHLRPGEWDAPLATGAASTDAKGTNGSVLHSAPHHPSSEEESGSESDSL